MERLGYNPKIDVEAVFGSKLYFGFYNPRTTKHPGGYAHYFWAKDTDAALEVATLLGLGSAHYGYEDHAPSTITCCNEEHSPRPRLLVVSVPNPVRDLKRYLKRRFDHKALARAQHSVAHLAYMGLRSGALTHGDTVGDQGFIHELSHYAHFGHNPPSRGYQDLSSAGQLVLAEVLRSCHEVPGYLPKNLEAWTAL